VAYVSMRTGTATAGTCAWATPMAQGSTGVELLV